MFARLCWKEFRVFWPLATTLAVAGLGAQSLLTKFAGDDGNGAVLFQIALGFAALYACAVGAAAFAGERETGTLTLFDGLPLTRRDLWLGKVAFALLST